MPKHNQSTEDAELFTVREVAKALRVDDTTVRRWVQSGDLEAVHLPRGGIRIRRETLEAILYPPRQSPKHE